MLARADNDNDDDDHHHQHFDDATNLLLRGPLGHLNCLGVSMLWSLFSSFRLFIISACSRKRLMKTTYDDDDDDGDDVVLGIAALGGLLARRIQLDWNEELDLQRCALCLLLISPR